MLTVTKAAADMISEHMSQNKLASALRIYLSSGG